MARDARRRASIRWSCVAAALLACLGLGVCYRGSSLPAPSNVVLISLDTLRPDHLGVYGYARDTSPRIDALAAESFVFDRALASAPNTPPSQMSMMTSLYPPRHGFTGKGDRLAPGLETLAARMRQAGFRTAGFVDGGYLRARFGFDRGFETYDDAGGGFAAILPRAIRWLEARGDEPFFLFLHTYDIHAPYGAPPPFRDLFVDAPYLGSFVPTAANMLRVFRGKIELDEADLRYITSRYDEGIRYTDTHLGSFVQYLERRGFLGRTALIVTSDHGEEFGEHGSVLHWQLYFAPNLRVPLLIRPPGGAGRAIRIGAQVELIDLLPTILDWVGAPPLEAAQGRSFLSTLTHARSAWRRPVERALAALGPAPTAYAWWPDPAAMPLRSAVRGHYQLIFSEAQAGAAALFDIEADPFAQLDLAADRQPVVERLRGDGLRVMVANRPRPREEAGGVDAETEEQLRALGYEQ